MESINDPMISGIILAAGSSRRMGTPKALLKIGNKTFLEHIYEILRSARIVDIVIVLGADSEKIIESVRLEDKKHIVNPEWKKGQLTSIIAGLNGFGLNDPVREEIHGAMVCPVDHPLITQGLLVDLLQGFWVSRKKIIVPTYKNMRGHPVIFARDLFNEIREAPTGEGARKVVHDHSGDVHEVPTEESGVVHNIDTPEDYKKYILDHAL